MKMIYRNFKRVILCMIVLCAYLSFKWMMTVTVQSTPKMSIRQSVAKDNKETHGITSDGISRNSFDNKQSEEDMYEARQISDCKEKQNFVFIKVMKCATESLGPMFRKFGYDRNLTYVLPVEDRIWIGWPFPFNKYDYRPSRRSYNILVEHSIYNKTALRNLMPEKTVYISSLREPFTRFKSAFNFFHLERKCKMTNHTNPISEYLRYVQTVSNYDCIGIFTDWRRFCPPVSFSQTHNEMSHSLGMPLGFPPGRKNIEHNITAINNYIQQLDKDFDLVLIVEYLHESLILLKRLMCWSFKDIFYIKRNVVNYSYKNTPPLPADVKFYKEWNKPDYLLYKHFNDSLWRKIEQQTDDFTAEVTKFTEIQREGEEYCLWKEYRQKGGRIHFFNETRWSAGFNITEAECHLLLTDMLQHLKDVYDVHERQFHPPPNIKTCRL